MKLFGIICFVILLVAYISALQEKPENQSGNGVYYGSDADKFSKNEAYNDEEAYNAVNGEDAYINGY